MSTSLLISDTRNAKELQSIQRRVATKWTVTKRIFVRIPTKTNKWHWMKAITMQITSSTPLVVALLAGHNLAGKHIPVSVCIRHWHKQSALFYFHVVRTNNQRYFTFTLCWVTIPFTFCCNSSHKLTKTNQFQTLTFLQTKLNLSNEKHLFL